jgi:hypothetical protein
MSALPNQVGVLKRQGVFELGRPQSAMREAVAIPENAWRNTREKDRPPA